MRGHLWDSICRILNIYYLFLIITGLLIILISSLLCELFLILKTFLAHMQALGRWLLAHYHFLAS